MLEALPNKRPLPKWRVAWQNHCVTDFQSLFGWLAAFSSKPAKSAMLHLIPGIDIFFCHPSPSVSLHPDEISRTVLFLVSLRSEWCGVLPSGCTASNFTPWDPLIAVTPTSWFETWNHQVVISGRCLWCLLPGIFKNYNIRILIICCTSLHIL